MSQVPHPQSLLFCSSLIANHFVLYCIKSLEFLLSVSHKWSKGLCMSSSSETINCVDSLTERQQQQPRFSSPNLQKCSWTTFRRNHCQILCHYVQNIPVLKIIHWPQIDNCSIGVFLMSSRHLSLWLNVKYTSTTIYWRRFWLLKFPFFTSVEMSDDHDRAAVVLCWFLSCLRCFMRGFWQVSLHT